MGLREIATDHVQIENYIVAANYNSENYDRSFFPILWDSLPQNVIPCDTIGTFQ